MAIIAIGNPVARTAQDFLDWLDARDTPGETLADLWNGTPSGLLIDDPAMAIAVFAQFRSTFAKALGPTPRRTRRPAPAVAWPDDFALTPAACTALAIAKQDFDHRHPYDPLGWIAISSPLRAAETTIRLAFIPTSCPPPDGTRLIDGLTLALNAPSTTLPRFIAKRLDFEPPDGFFLRAP